MSADITDAPVPDGLLTVAVVLRWSIEEVSAEFQLPLNLIPDTDYADKTNRPAWMARRVLRDRADELLDESHEMAKAADRINVEVPGQVDLFGGDS